MSTKTTKTITTRRKRGPQQKPKRKQTVKKTVTVQRPARKAQRRARATGNTKKNYIHVRRTITPYEIDEMVDVVNGNPSFTAKAFALNPGNANLFPLLSKHARLFDRYEFDDLEFSFQPDQSYIGVQGQAGFVDISVTADALQPVPQTQQAAEILPHCPQGPLLTSKPWNLCIPKKFMQNSIDEWRYVRPDGNIPGGADPHLYDAGQIFLWVSGQTNTTKCGQFKVKGRVRCYNSVLEPSSLPSPNFTIGQIVQTTDIPLVSGVLTPIPFSDVSPSNGYANNIGLVNDTGVVKLPVGNYKVSSTVKITDASLTGIQLTLLKNGSVVWTNVFTTTSTFLSLYLAPFFVQSNGTDVFSVAVTATGTSLNLVDAFALIETA